MKYMITIFDDQGKQTASYSCSSTLDALLSVVEDLSMEELSTLAQKVRNKLTTESRDD